MKPGHQLHLSLLYAAYGWLLLSGTLHFGIDVVGQYVRGKRSPCNATTLYYGLNSAYALSQVLFAALALLAISPGVSIVDRWPGLILGFLAALSWLAICALFWTTGSPACPLDCSRPFSLQRPSRNQHEKPTCNNDQLWKGTTMKLTGRTILITGGTSGIGLELAKQLIAQRNTVLITGRDAERLSATKAKIAVHTYVCDAGNPADIQKLQSTIAAEFPKLDTLINNAGIMRNLDLNQPHGLTDVTLELAVNLCGPVQMVQAFLPGLKTRPDALIVNVSSGLAFVPFPLSPMYSAAKAGIHAYTRCLRAQLKGSSVRVVELAPPGTETPLFRGEFAKEMKGQKGMDVQALVKEAIAGIESRKTEVRPGLSNVLYVLSRVAPRLPFGQMAKMLPTATKGSAIRIETNELGRIKP